jgi:hypothetical protein
MNGTNSGRIAGRSETDTPDLIKLPELLKRWGVATDHGKAALCPICGHRPFTIRKASWSCRGMCRRGGDIFDLVALLYRVTRKRAGKLLAELSEPEAGQKKGVR